MDDYIIVGGNRYPCRFRIEQPVCYITVKMGYDEVKSVFTDGVAMVVDFGQEQKDLSDFRIGMQRIDNFDGTFTVAYRKMSDLEKLIELHYGGVNNEGSI